MKNLCFFVTGITDFTVAVSNLPTFYTGDSVCHFRRQTRIGLGCCRFDETFCDQRRDGRTKWPQSTVAGARGDGKGRQVSCLPSSRWPPGRRGCGTHRRCDRASLRTRLRSRREIPKFPSRGQIVLPGRGVSSRVADARPGPTPARPVTDSPPTSNPRFRVRSAHTSLPSLSRPDRGDPHDGGPARGEG